MPSESSRQPTVRRDLLRLIAGLSLVVAAPAGAQVRFAEVGAARGITPYAMAPGMGSGVAAADYDDDGDVDLFVPTAEGTPDQLYRNLGDGTFEEVAEAAGVASRARGRVALFFDFDGDRLLDLFVASDCFREDDHNCLDPQPCEAPLRLYRQTPGGTFEDVTAAAGFTDDLVVDSCQHRSGMSAGDVDNDGDLDLFLGLWGPGSARWLFRNGGDGTFTEVGAASGIDEGSYYWQPVMHDFDGDGWLDIYAALDVGLANQQWMNQGDGTFVDVAPVVGSDLAWNEMGVTLGDADNDGDLDIYVTNIELEEMTNLIVRNDSSAGALLFTPLSGTGTESGGWGWGTTFLDADNDGDLDLAATNGIWDWVEGFEDDSSRFFLNDGSATMTFAEVSDAVGFNDELWGSSLVAVDADRDGDLDLVQTCHTNSGQTSRLRLLDNRPEGAAGSHHYLNVKPRMSGRNHRAIGAVVRAEAGGRDFVRLITAGTSFLGQEPAEAFFGLGTASFADRVIIEWPGGGPRTVLENVAADRELVVELLFGDGFESGNLGAWSGRSD